MSEPRLPPGQQLVAAGKWPTVGERTAREDDSPWVVHIGGAVRQPCSFTLADLRSWPPQEKIVDIHCVTRWSKPGVRFSGVPLAEMLDRAEPDSTARYVSFVARSERCHSTSLPLADALQLETWIAVGADGRPLSAERGGPVRVVVPGRYFYKSLKWLETIELLSEDRLGFWEQTAGYHNTADPWQQERYMVAGVSKEQAREILEKRDVSGRELLSLDARGRELGGFLAVGAILRDADFRDCDLQGARFDGANLTNAHFEGADLRGATLRATDLAGANLSGADLRGACLTGASLFGASFCDESNEVKGASRKALVDARTQIEPEALEGLTPKQHAFLAATLAAVATP